MGDVDADGDLDLLALGTYPDGDYYEIENRLRCHYGTGLGTFSGNLDLAPQYGSTSRLFVGDVTGDGLADVLAGGSDLVELFAASGGGGLAAPVPYGTGVASADGVLVDFDGDGWLDLARSVAGKTLWSWQASVSVMLNAGNHVPGAEPFGTGTPGCLGTLGLAATSAPSVGNLGFALTVSGLAPGGLALGYLSLAGDLAGTDPFGLGLVLHIDPSASPSPSPFAFASAASGSALAKLPIPDQPALANLDVYAQAFSVQPPGLAWRRRRPRSRELARPARRCAALEGARPRAEALEIARGTRPRRARGPR